MNRFTETIHELTRLIRAIRIDDYVKARLGDLSLEHMRGDLEKFFDRLEKTSEVAYALDDKFAEKLANTLRRIQKDFQDLANVPPERFPNERDSWLETLRSGLGEFNAHWPSIAAEIRGSFEIPQVDWDEFLRRVQEETKNSIPNIAPLTQQLASVEKRLNTVQSKQAAQVTARNFRQYFKRQAESHSRKLRYIPKNKRDGTTLCGWKYGGAQLWLFFSLISTVVLCSVLLGWTTGFSLTKQVSVAADPTRGIPASTLLDFNPSAIPGAIGHVLFLSVLLFVVRFCFRQYSIHQHLHTVNTHKSNLAGTFSEMMNSTVGEDEGARAIVTQETIRTLANFEGSGYVDSANPDMHSPIEIIAKGFVDTAKTQSAK